MSRYAAGWTRLTDPKRGTVAQAHIHEATGWKLVHCGHPTALYPWYLVDPEHPTVPTVSETGRAFRTMVAAFRAHHLAVHAGATVEEWTPPRGRTRQTRRLVHGAKP